MDRISLIEQRLQEAFSPTHLQVIDESHFHIGHPGAQNGAGHFSIIIASSHFSGLSRLMQHRKIYHVLSDLIPHPIHALKIEILS